MTLGITMLFSNFFNATWRQRQRQQQVYVFIVRLQHRLQSTITRNLESGISAFKSQFCLLIV